MTKQKPLAMCMPNDRVEAGCDEAGRGCLAGPVFAAAVILPPGFLCPTLNDSKKLSEKAREQLRPLIEQKALAYAVEMCTAQEIDQMNILQASIRAMHRALARLSVRPRHILIDGNRFRPFEDISHTCVIKGDGKYMSIAAASILAKTYRDAYMRELHTRFPYYDWEHNKGYPTRTHREAIVEHGITEHHRTSFQLLNKQFCINFAGS